MNPRRRILLDKLRELPLEHGQPDGPELSELREETRITEALAQMRIKAGPEPERGRMLAVTEAQASNHREKQMNPIIRLLSDRPWPARLAITACCLLALAAAAQFPFRTSYAQTGGRAIVFDLGVASNESEENAKREMWAEQSRRILDCFRAINASAHRVSMLSDPLSDNLLSMSGVIFLMDDEQQDLEERSADNESAANNPEQIRRRVQELQEEISMLSNGGDEHSEKEIARAREELEKAQAQLLEVMANREDKLSEAGKLIEVRLKELEGSGEQEGALFELKVALEEVRQAAGEQSSEHSAEIRAELERMVSETRQEALRQAELELREHADEIDVEAVLREIEESLEIEMSEENMLQLQAELEGGRLELQVELSDALAGLDSLDKLREMAIEDLRSEKLELHELKNEVQRLELQGLDSGLLELKVELENVPGPELELELEELKLDLERELSTLEGLPLTELKVELQRLEEMKGALLELQLPEGELLELTMLEELNANGPDSDKISFRFQDHLFSFPRKTSAARMASTVNDWLSKNGYDCRVRVELCYDDDGKICGAVPKVR